MKTALLAAALLAAAASAGAERDTQSASYPSPSGAYSRVIATGDAVLSRDAHVVEIGTDGPPGAAALTVRGGGVGVGTLSPATGSGVDVSGVVRASRDLLVNGASAILDVLCAPDTGLECVKRGNTLHVSKAACAPTTCDASLPAACGQTNTGTDDCGNTCYAVSADCCVATSCDAAIPACGTATGTDNCGAACTVAGPAPCPAGCVPAPGSCGAGEPGAACGAPLHDSCGNVCGFQRTCADVWDPMNKRFVPGYCCGDRCLPTTINCF